MGCVQPLEQDESNGGLKERVKAQAAKAKGRIRNLLQQPNWKDLAAQAAEDKKGWRLFGGQVMLCQASKKYGRCVTLEPGTVVPFNETADWAQPGGADHWFEILLNTPIVEADTGLFITGRLFTTRMPRGLDDQPGDYTGVVPEGATDKKRFIQKVKDNSVKNVFVLVESHEFAHGKSSDLLEFYKSLGMQVFHTPIKDFHTPTIQVEEQNIEELNIRLKNGENCLIHCWGGSGRTGTVAVGAVRNFGVDNPVKYCRQFKSVYLDIREQEQFLEEQTARVTTRMMEECPELITSVVLGRLEELSVKHEGKELLEFREHGYDEDETKALRQLFDIIDCHGEDGVVSINQIAEFTKSLGKRVQAAGSFDETLTGPKLQSLFARFDEELADVSLYQDSISFELFMKVMNTKVQLVQESQGALKLKESQWASHAAPTPTPDDAETDNKPAAGA